MPFCRSEGRSEISEEVEEGLEPGGGQGGRTQRGRERQRQCEQPSGFVEMDSILFFQSDLFLFEKKTQSLIEAVDANC